MMYLFVRCWPLLAIVLLLYLGTHIDVFGLIRTDANSDQAEANLLLIFGAVSAYVAYLQYFSQKRDKNRPGFEVTYASTVPPNGVIGSDWYVAQPRTRARNESGTVTGNHLHVRLGQTCADRVQIAAACMNSLTMRIYGKPFTHSYKRIRNIQDQGCLSFILELRSDSDFTVEFDRAARDCEDLDYGDSYCQVTLDVSFWVKDDLTGEYKSSYRFDMKGNPTTRVLRKRSDSQI